MNRAGSAGSASAHWAWGPAGGWPGTPLAALLGVLLHQAGGGWRQLGRLWPQRRFYSGFGVVAALTAPPSASSAAPTRKGAAVEKRAMRNPHAA